MYRQQEVTALIEDAHLIWMNFRGDEKQFNPAGRRNFSVVLEEDVARNMLADNWVVKEPKDREVDGEVIPGNWTLPVSVKYKFRPPEVYMITGKNKTLLSEELVGLIDDADIVCVDLIVKQVPWDVSGKSGFKTYLKKAFITINQDPLDIKYADLED